MTIKEFVEKAKAGGWTFNDVLFGGNLPDEFIEWLQEPGQAEIAFHLKSIFLDIKAWEAVGKVDGWGAMHFCDDSDSCGNSGCYPVYRDKMHSMIDHLIEGGTIETYIETL